MGSVSESKVRLYLYACLEGGPVLPHLMVDLLNLCVGLLYYLGLCVAGAGVRQYKGMNRTESWFEVEALKSGVLWKKFT
jgi:hypothetical protein